MRKLYSAPILFVVWMLVVISVTAANEVKRNFSDLSTTEWKKNWSTAEGSWKTVKDVPSDEGIDAKGSMEVQVGFKQGFSYFSYGPVESKIPGKLHGVSLWAKYKDKGLPCIVVFTVKDAPKGKKYEWNVKLTDKWKHYTFRIPDDWPKVTGFNLSAWAKGDSESNATLLLNNLQMITDTDSVEDKSSLIEIAASTGRPRNIFLHNENITYNVTLGSWVGTPIKGTLAIKLTDIDGKEVLSKQEAIALNESYSKQVSFKPKRFGVYTMNITVALDGQKEFRQTSRCMYIPEIANTTYEQKRHSPWGINIHGGKPGVAYSSIAKMGFCWIRDYAYSYPWIAKGRRNGDWKGWPWYLTMDEKIKKAGLQVLPCMSKGIRTYIEKNPTPPRNWKDSFVHLLMKFPEYTAVECDNELELDYPDVKKDGYEAYGEYHKRFAEIIKLINPDVWSVSEGTAGLQPELVEKMVKKGYYKDIDVVNGHFYTGIPPALMSQQNANTGQASSIPAHFYDKLRAFVRASDADGKDRQSWVTEFGWDTLAVKIVSEKEQAAYAQRGYTLGLIGGLNKMFWYWNWDTTNKPKVFFDGMGVFGPKRGPKPVAAAISAMIHFLQFPKPVGSFDMGPNSYGHVFADRGRLVALAFKIDKEKDGPTVTFKSGTLYDMYANPVEGRTHKLDITPIWIDNISPYDPLVKATMFDMPSNWLILGAGGDECTVDISINNTEKKTLQGTLDIRVPKGWKVTKDVKAFSVNPGKKEVVTVKAIIPDAAPESIEYIEVDVKASDVRRTFRTQVQVIPPATTSTVSIVGAPGKSPLKFKLNNNSLSTRTFVLEPSLPKGWSATPKQMVVKDMPTMSEKDVSFEIIWKDNFAPTDRAVMKVLDKNGTLLTTIGIIVPTHKLPLVKNIKFDGSLDDWPMSARIPDWSVGKNGTPDNVELCAAYSPEGLYIGVKVEPSRALGDNPDSFWSMDCIEIGIDSVNDKSQRKGGWQFAKTDHHFWMVPIVKENRAYLGRWTHNTDIPQTLYDIKGVTSGVKKTKNGYILEAMIPAKIINGFEGKAGNSIGLVVNIVAPGISGTVNAYWPRPKSEKIIKAPQLWGSAKME